MTNPPAPPADSAPRRLLIAIDGPAGSGKSTVAKAVAERLGIPHLDTGAMYRSLTWAALQRQLSADDTEKLRQLARDLDFEIGPGQVRVDGVDVTDEIRGALVSHNVSAMSTDPDVRSTLRDRQRAWGRQAGGVMEGRDIGTVVFPDASLKVFLTASIDVRARRRAAESGRELESVRAELAGRDEKDGNRQHAPLRQADDAVAIDTSAMSIEEVVDAIVALATTGPGR